MKMPDYHYQLTESVAELVDNYVIEWLKSKGYKPRKTTQYFEKLKKRLDKKGKVFIIYQNSIIDKVDYDNCKLKTKLFVMCDIVNKGEEKYFYEAISVYLKNEKNVNYF